MELNATMGFKYTAKQCILEQQPTKYTSIDKVLYK